MSTVHPILVTGAAGRIGGVAAPWSRPCAARPAGQRAWSAARTNGPPPCGRPAPRSPSATSPAPRTSRVPWKGAGGVLLRHGVSAPTWRHRHRPAVARARGGPGSVVNMSQMTVSEMSLTETTDSPQHRQHGFAEQALNWFGVARRPRPPDGVLAEPHLPRLGRPVDPPRRHDPAALGLRADVADRHPGTWPR